MDEGFAACAVMGEGLSSKVDNIVTYPIVTCHDKTSVAADYRVTHRKSLQATVTFHLKGRGVNVITCT